MSMPPNVHFLEPALVGLTVLFGVVQERSVGPTAHEEVVVGLVVDDPLQPAQGHGQVGAHAQRQPHVGFLSQRGHAGVDEDMLVGALAAIDHGAVGRVVVGIFGSGAPLDVDQRALFDFHPRRADFVGQDAGEVARALADLVGQMRVRRGEDRLERAVGRLRPHARGAAHGEAGFAAVLVGDLAQLGAGLVERLAEADAHPARVVFALGVGALHAIAQTVGMVQGQHGRLRLGAAVTTAVGARFVALDLDHLVVLDGDPNAALDFAASTAAGTDALNFTCRLVFALCKRVGRLCRESQRCSGAGDGCRLHEATACQ